MKVGLGIPMWGDDPDRLRNFEYVFDHMAKMYPWQNVIAGSPDYKQNRGAARNHLMRRMEDCDVVVLCDADTYPTLNGLMEAMMGARAKGGLHFAYDRFRAITRYGTELLLSGRVQHPGHDLPLESECLGSLGGVMAMTPTDWWNAGGSPELKGWGFEDVIFAVQARTLIRDNEWHTGTITHLWHPSSVFIGSDQYNKNIAECKRYEAASGDPAAIRALIRER